MKTTLTLALAIFNTGLWLYLVRQLVQMDAIPTVGALLFIVAAVLAYTDTRYHFGEEL